VILERRDANQYVAVQENVGQIVLGPNEAVGDRYESNFVGVMLIDSACIVEVKELYSGFIVDHVPVGIVAGIVECVTRHIPAEVPVTATGAPNVIQNNMAYRLSYIK